MDWPSTPSEAFAIQDELRPQLLDGPVPITPSTFAGVDVAYGEDRLAAAVVVLEADLSVRETAVVIGEPAFPYVPGLFAFRELPAVLDAFSQLKDQPEVVVCDGQGRAHPRRFGLACHLGVLLDLPTLGVGKTRLVGEADEPGERRGDRSALIDRGDEVGALLRTQDRVKPVYVSAGHRMDLDTACALTLRLTSRYRLPETTRAADHACRAALKSATR
ncbi:endonuclease V [Actinoplanes sp. NPDC051470]|uniref:endonuclease V n=1 Tax=unclassified Actinoplanes TaxID=2626549 RepID=UPI00344A5C2F